MSLTCPALLLILIFSQTLFFSGENTIPKTSYNGFLTEELAITDFLGIEQNFGLIKEH